MKKLFLLLFSFLLTVSILVKANVLQDIAYTYKMLSNGFKNLLAMDITDSQERKRIVVQFREKICIQKDLLKNLLETGKISEEDFFQMRVKYASLYVQVCDWGKNSKQ